MKKDTSPRKLTKSFVDSIPFATTGQAFYRDSELKGFGLRVGAQTKVYIAEGRVNDKVVRVSIGKHGVFTAEQARNEARSILGQFARNINPNEVEKAERARSVTLAQVLEDFLKARKNLKPRTVADYRSVMSTYLVDWQNKPIAEITKDMVGKRHTAIATGLKITIKDRNGEPKEANYCSPSQANLSMRYLRALFNFASSQYEDGGGQSIISDNPVKRLSQTRAWYHIARRQTVIKAHELGAWFKAVTALENDQIGPQREIVRDYLLLLILTGLRREEAAMLTWKNVDLKAKTLTILDTKNRQDHVLPLSDYLYDLLVRRRAESISSYVFPGEGVKGYLVEPRNQMERVISESGITFTLHDLRRTFITIAESLDIPAYALKRLINHKMSNDVTAGYIIADVERLRPPMQKITDYILKCAGIKPSADVVALVDRIA